MSNTRKIIAAIIALLALLGGGYGVQQSIQDETVATGASDFNLDAPAGSFWRKSGNTLKVFPVTTDISVPSSKVATGEFTQGGGCTTLTDATGGTYTLTQAQMLAANCFVFAAGGAGQEVIALTLPATSTMTTLIPNVGDTRSWFYDASALAVATTTTITLGTGIDIIAYTNADDVIDGAEYAQITCWRQPDTDVTCLTSELLAAD